MTSYRAITSEEIATLREQGCFCSNWDLVFVTEDFDPKYVRNVKMSGTIKLPHFSKKIELPGGVVKRTGIYNATLHNVTVGEECCIENIHNYIANYTIGKNCIIENVDKIVCNTHSSFGNGVKVSVLNETGGREVSICDKLSAHFAYIMTLYRHRSDLIEKMKEIVNNYEKERSSDRGVIGDCVKIINTGQIESVKVGCHSVIEGAQLLTNGTINSNKHDPVYIGYGVYLKDFIVSSGATIDSGCTFEKCFIGQSSRFGKTYSAENSLFFSNCQGYHGEASAIFAGPYTVTFHKSTLLIAGMFSFMNAGSGSNQSNHLYKLGPIHQGILERGAKTSSDSYILWPARIGAFSLVMGRHVNNTDTSMLPFSYLIERENTTYLIPGVNLKSVGTIRDALKWPARDERKDPERLDNINYNLLSPYTIEKMVRGRDLLQELKKISGETTDIFSYKSTKITNSALCKGIEYYQKAIDKFMGNSVIKRLEAMEFNSNSDIVERLKPDTPIGKGIWLDLSGLIAPKSEIEKVLGMIESGQLNSLGEINSHFDQLHQNYYHYEWSWVYEKFETLCGISPEEMTAHHLVQIVERWRSAVIGIDEMLYDDAKKEFSLTAMTSFGADGNEEEAQQDFEQVRGIFESNQFVSTVTNHIKEKNELGDELLSRIEHLLT